MNFTRHFSARQQGFTLILLIFVVGLGATAYLMTTANQASLQSDRDKKTMAALALAKNALIGWAAANPAKPGTLPCTDTANTGSAVTSGTSCTAYVGRLPWKQLGIGDVRDGSGECLWYALSPVFRNAMNVSGANSRVNFPLNSNTSGSITLNNDRGQILASHIVAVILAPGAPLPGQNRAKTGNAICGGNTTAGNYLDAANGIDNATGNYDAATLALTFVSGEPGPSFNDKLIAITMEDLYGPLRKRIAAEMLGTSAPTYGLLWYYNANHVYPWAANASYAQQAGSTSQFIPYGDLNFAVSALNTWLINNQWRSLITYTVGTDFQPGTTYPQQCGNGCLTVRGQQAQASVRVGGGNTSWTARVCSRNTLVASCPLP